MPGWSGKSKGGAFGYRFFFALIRHTNLRITYLLVRVVALYYLVFTNKSSLWFYFRKVHGYPRLRSLAAIYKNYCILGEVLVDKVAILSGEKSGFTFDFEGEEHLLKMSSEGRGGVLVGAHLGNWEVAGQLLDRIPTKVNIVMVEAERENIRSILGKYMVKKALTVIPQKDDLSHLFLIEEAFNRREFVVMHGDRYLPGTTTVTVPFFGRNARFPSGPLYLASKKGVPVSFVYTLKDSANHYRFFATPGKIFPYPARMTTRKEEIRKMVGSYVASLEEILRRYPHQWFNYYPFWDEEIKTA